VLAELAAMKQILARELKASPRPPPVVAQPMQQLPTPFQIEAA
jgi:hypothetical protein